jgi:protein tyrosine/serine phosphatase
VTSIARALAVFGAAVCLLSAAEPVTQVAGVGNFYQVNQQVYRGAQPTPEGFTNLAKLGIGTILDLREAGPRAKAEERIVRAAGMRYINLPLRGLSAPEAEDMAKALSILNDEKAGPVFVHCRRGADRTGTVLACYRISHDGWDNRKALHEARTNGMSWIERAMQSYVLAYHAPTQAPAAAAAVAAAQ